MTDYQAHVDEELINDVTLYAMEAHKGTPRRFTGDPYFVHPLAVAESVWKYGTDYIVVALLHDVVEDTPITMKDLDRRFVDGFTEATYDAIDRITQRRDESNEKYHRRVKPNKISRIVKVADMLNNLRDFHMFGKEKQIRNITKQMLYLMM